MARLLASVIGVIAVAAGLAAAAPGAQTACQPTVSDGPGPFQRLDAPRRGKIGTGHVLLGRILRAGDCAPVARARVFFWQAGLTGYGPRGRGNVLTDRRGRFRIEGPMPTAYGGGPPHIHIAVIHPAYEELLARYVVRRGATTSRIRLVLTPLL
jgi:protocatechuate 3,4-dioxygenase beta subunit